MIGNASLQSLGSRHEHDRADVCVIGAGIAGLICATRIAARSTLRVIVIESGGQVATADPALAALDEVSSSGAHYQGTARARGIGGSSSKWAGKLLPLSAGDTAARPWVNLEAWPIDRAVLDAYTADIELLLGVDSSGYEHESLNMNGLALALPNGCGAVRWRWPKRPSRANHRIDHVLRQQIATLDNLFIWTDATVVALQARDGRLATITARNHQGGQLQVAADSFVITAGTLESTRLLLIGDAQNDGVISRTTSALGRYFNDHFGMDVATVRASDLTRVNRALADRAVNKVMRHLHGELSSEAQKQRQVGSAYFDMDAAFSPDSTTGKAREFVQAVRDRHLGAATRLATGLATEASAIARAVAWRARYRQQFWPLGTSIRVKIWIEQFPRAANYLALSSRVDTLGSPMIDVRCDKDDVDNRTLTSMIESLDQCWATGLASMARLDWTIPIVADERRVDLMTEQAHPAGSTRMGRVASQSVVDPMLRVHALPNVLVASASVFPSSGSANPTLTIMQIAMHAADTVLRDH